MPRFRLFKKPFSELSQHKKRDLYIRLRGKINHPKNRYSKNFLSTIVLDEPNRPALFDRNATFYFLGLDGHTIWNAYLFSASDRYWHEISDLASKKANELRPERDFSFKDLMIPVYDANGKKDGYTIREQKSHPEFGNKTRREFIDEYTAKLIREDTGHTVEVYEEFRIEQGFEYGVGLYITLDEPTINIEAIETAIARFRALGEKPWKSSTPVPHSHLPKKTFEVLFKEYEEDRMQEEINTLIHEAHEEIQAEMMHARAIKSEAYDSVHPEESIALEGTIMDGLDPAETFDIDKINASVGKAGN